MEQFTKHELSSLYAIIESYMMRTPHPLPEAGELKAKVQELYHAPFPESDVVELSGEDIVEMEREQTLFSHRMDEVATENREHASRRSPGLTEQGMGEEELQQDVVRVWNEAFGNTPLSTPENKEGKGCVPWNERGSVAGSVVVPDIAAINPSPENIAPFESLPEEEKKRRVFAKRNSNRSLNQAEQDWWRDNQGLSQVWD